MSPTSGSKLFLGNPEIAWNSNTAIPINRKSKYERNSLFRTNILNR